MPIMQVAGQMNLLQSGLASAERVFELLDAEEETPDAVTDRRLGDVSGEVALEHVGFRYEPEKPLIDDFNLRVEPGQTVAIVGPTGAGKTTIVNLLMRFYDIDSGRICLDASNTGELPRDEVRKAFGMVLQDTWLFAGTIRDNIAYGREGASEDEIIAAAQAAHVDSFVRTLPKGYDTVLDEDASDLSSGQRQLLTIARAFLADPSILILDEATSNVDTRTEVLIQKAMAQLRHGRTSFVIAHRLSAARSWSRAAMRSSFAGRASTGSSTTASSPTPGQAAATPMDTSWISGRWRPSRRRLRPRSTTSRLRLVRRTRRAGAWSCGSAWSRGGWARSRSSRRDRTRGRA